MIEPRLLLRGHRDQPGQRPRPDQGTGNPLGEAGGVEQEDLLDQAEDQAGDAEYEEAVDDRSPRPQPAGDEARGERGDQSSGRVGGRENAGLGLAEPEIGNVIRKQWRDRSEEGDVEEDHCRRQDEQLAHIQIQSVQASLSGDACL